MRKHKLLLDLIAGHTVDKADVVPLAAPASPIGGHHHHHAPPHALGSAASAAGGSAEGDASAETPPLPKGVTWISTHNGGCDVHAPRFHMLTADLRDIAAVQATLAASGIDFSVPTLFLSE
jgi:hypothetical protein